ncbi:DUF1499 domain-containing protein [Candidatus Babeliales bacterium]|nr:DUF1499 domain-containing protein [Candidatus Babeliales bacterium]
MVNITINRLLFGLFVVGIFQPLCGLGVNDGSLTPCDSQWHCVITQNVNGEKPNAEPLTYHCSRQEAQQTLKDILSKFTRTTVVEERPGYIHAICESRLWKFIDDVEFYLPPDLSVIHIRSASRTGIYDFGVNKRRVKRLKRLFSEILVAE